MENIENILEEVFAKLSVLASVKLAADTESHDLLSLNSTQFEMLFGKKAYCEIECLFDEKKWNNLNVVLETFSRENMKKLLDVSDCLACTPNAISAQVSILYVRTCHVFIYEGRVWKDDRIVKFIEHISKKLMNQEINDMRPKEMFVDLAQDLPVNEFTVARKALVDYLANEMNAFLADGINRINLN